MSKAAKASQGTATRQTLTPTQWTKMARELVDLSVSLKSAQASPSKKR
jgi:hypothetical protein